MRWIDKISAWLRAQGVPKYQHLYLGQGDGKLRVKGGGVAVVKNCYYEQRLGCYMYWLDANGVMVTVPECHLEPL